MKIRISRVDPRTHRLAIERVPHDPVDVILESRSTLLHDLAHYALEAELETSDGFWGLLAAGRTLGELRDGESLPPGVHDALMSIERRVAMLQSAFTRGVPQGDDRAWSRLRAVHGAWRSVRQDQALELDWPPGPPRVVSR